MQSIHDIPVFMNLLLKEEYREALAVAECVHAWVSKQLM
jgi:hypothetical protein